jgi:ribosomal protein S8E
MRFSGKKIVIGMFVLAIALCYWVRVKAPKPRPEGVSAQEIQEPKKKHKPGYRRKVYPTMEQARNTAEKKLAEISPEKKMITSYKSSGDGWLFFYENEKYLNFGKPEDKSKETTPIFVSKDGVADFYVEDVKRH